jgi:TIR domain
MKRYGEEFYRESYLQSQPVNFGVGDSLLKESTLIKSQSAEKKWDIFLSHSSKDKIIVLNFKKLLNNFGFLVYVDWIEDSDSERGKITPMLKKAMVNSKVLIYLHSHNSKTSIWTPWEIGYFDSNKGNEFIGIVPLEDENKDISSYNGQEYLLQYTEIGKTKLNSFIKNGILNENEGIREIFKNFK